MWTCHHQSIVFVVIHHGREHSDLGSAAGPGSAKYCIMVHGQLLGVATQYLHTIGKSTLATEKQSAANLQVLGAPLFSAKTKKCVSSNISSSYIHMLTVPQVGFQFLDYAINENDGPQMVCVEISNNVQLSPGTAISLTLTSDDCSDAIRMYSCNHSYTYSIHLVEVIIKSSNDNVIMVC